MKRQHMFRTLATIGMVGALTLTGCQGIPTSGSVHSGLTDLTQAQQDIQYRPDKPMPDATQEEILRGFLQAASSATDDYEIARQFLTNEYINQWDPNMSVIIDEGARSFSAGGEDIATLKLAGIASINDRGMLTQIEPGESTQVPFEFEQEDGQWRISSAPNGVILDRATFLDVWSQHQLFFAGYKQSLVPDARWVLNRATTSTHIVNQLLEGPPPELDLVAHSAFPAGTRLVSDAVIIDGGTARIDLSSEFDSISESELELVERQLSASLYSVSSVAHFVVTVEGIEVLSGSVAPPQTLVVETSEMDAFVGVVKRDVFGYLNGSGFKENLDFTHQFVELNPKSIVMNRTEQAAAVLAPGGIYWVTPDDVYLIDDRAGLIEPTIDQLGYVWLMQGNNPETLTVWHPQRDPVTIETPELEQHEIAGARISPDGHRIAFLINDRLDSAVYTTSIIRDDTGDPTGFVDLADPVMNWASGVPLDLDWIDSQRFAVLSTGDTDTTRFTVSGPGLFSETRSGAQGAIALRSGGRVPLTYFLSSDGDLSTPQGTSGWQRQAQDVQVLSKRG